MKTDFRVVTLLAAWLLALPVSSWATDIAPDVLVKNTTQEVIAVIKQDKDIQSGQTKKLLGLVEAKVLPHFNFTRMTRLAVGKNWPKATPAQQQELVKEFRTLLVRTYSGALASFRDQAIEVKPLKMQAGDMETTVKTRVIQTSGQQPITIDYNMEKTADGWKVYDVTVGGVSLVTNYRGSFETQIRQGGVDGLVKTLAEKNRSPEAGNQTATSK